MKNKKELIILVSVVAILILVTAVIVIKNIRKNHKTIETDGQAINESVQEGPEETNEFEEDELEETEPVDENIIDENVVKESKVKDEKEVKDNKNKYYVKVNNQENVVTIYTKDSDGNYTVPVRAMICSIGTATPKSGQYKLNGTKHIWHTLFGHTPGTYVYGQYTTAIVGNILFHSVPYTVKGNPSTLEYLEYDKLGTKASAGCIRLTVQDAAWIYYNISAGTIVEFYNDSNPGPLGKPSAQKISGNTECRGWDPTDSDSRNPWRNNSSSTSTPSNNTTGNEQPKQEEPKQPENTQESNKENNQENKDNNTGDNEVSNNVIDNSISNNTIDNITDNNISTNDTVTNNTVINDIANNSTI